MERRVKNGGPLRDCRRDGRALRVPLYNRELGWRLTPAFSPDDEDYDDLASRWTPAALGTDTADFHVRLAMNQHRTYQRGLHPKGQGIGGQLHIACVNDNGAVTMWAAHEFPDYAAGCSLVHRRTMVRMQSGIPAPAAANQD